MNFPKSFSTVVMKLLSMTMPVPVAGTSHGLAAPAAVRRTT